MIDSKTDDNGADHIPKTTAITTKATFVDPDKTMASNGSWKVLPQTTYDVEKHLCGLFIGNSAIINNKTLIYIKCFLAIVFSILGAFLVTLPFAKVEQLKFLGFEYKVIQAESAEEVAADSLRTMYRKAEQAKSAAFRLFCSPKTTEINRRVWHQNNNADRRLQRMVHFGISVNSYLRLLEQQMASANFTVYAKLVSVVRGESNKVDMKMLKYRTEKDIIERVVELKRESFWETPDKQYLYATPLYLDDNKESNDFFIIVFRSKEIGFSSYDSQLLEAVKSHIDSQQSDLMSNAMSNQNIANQ